MKSAFCRRKRPWALWCIPVALVTWQGARAHELEANRLTIVQRDEIHLSLTFYIDYVNMLNRTLAPAASRAEFTALCSALPEERLRSQLRLAHSMFEKAIDISTASGKQLRISALRWPEFLEVRRLLREEAMRSVVDPSAHLHSMPVEIAGDALAAAPSNNLRVTLPPSLGTVVVVSYRPVQQSVAADRGQIVTIQY